MEMSPEERMRLMQTLDDAWNSQDWDTFEKRHARDVTVYWPALPEPTRGIDNHRTEAIAFFKIFPDNHIDNDPYKILFAQGDYTCSVARFTGSMQGPMQAPDGRLVQPTGKHFEIEFCTVAHWRGDEITEERLFYDLVGMLRQIGVM